MHNHVQNKLTSGQWRFNSIVKCHIMKMPLFLYAIFLFSRSSSPENMQWDAGGDIFHVWNLLGLTTLGGGSWPDLYIHAAAEGREFKERSAGAGAAGNRMKSWPQPSEVQTRTPPSLSAAPGHTATRICVASRIGFSLSAQSTLMTYSFIFCMCYDRCFKINT